jgi:4-amino-4-deoxy-L-arabinose transferase-like glycosyltransferase
MTKSTLTMTGGMSMTTPGASKSVPSPSPSTTQTTPLTPWSAADFDVTTWPVATLALNAPQLYNQPITPLLYNYPLSHRWLSSGAMSQGYFVRQISITTPVKNYWLRFRAAGPSTIFVNGNVLVYWTGQPPNTLQSVYGSFSYVNTDVKTHSRFSVGVYDIAPYLHSGVNTIAVYVSAPNVDGFIANTGAAMSVDMLASDYSGNTTLSEEDDAWRASPQFASGWENGGEATTAWQKPSQVPGTIDGQQFSIPGSNLVLRAASPWLGALMIPWPLICEVIGGSILAVLGLWLLMALTLGKRYYAPWPRACSIMSMAFLPALAVEVLFITLAREPHTTQPFPYNALCGLILLALVLAGYFLLWLNVRLKRADAPVKHPGHGLLSSHKGSEVSAASAHIRFSFLSWLCLYWPVLLLMAIGSALIIPTLSYEPLWQDELVSFYVAKQSVARGFPMMPSGFIYPKAELFHYMLGMIMLIFGDHLPVPRSLSAVEYIASIPLLFMVGNYFFGRRVALLAAATLTFSPYALTWGAQLRMYEQAQVTVLLMLYVFHRACMVPQSKRMPYIAIATLLLTYLSHEETFIVLPALALCVCVFTKDKRRFLPAVFYQKHWWYASLAGVAVISIQLLIVKFSHPPVLGTDQSMRPNVQFHEDGVPFYTTLLFFPKSTSPWVVLNSILAVIGSIWAIRSKDAHLRYCALFFAVAFATLVAIFTMLADRYFYPLLTIYYLLGSYVVWKTLEYLWTFASSQLLFMTVRPDGGKVAQGALSLPIRITSIAMAFLTCGCILLVPMLPISSYNLVVSRSFGLSYLHHFSDYDAAGAYVKSHWRDGDIVVSISPDIEMYYYLGRSDYYFSVDRALFLIENNGYAINTATGATAILSQTDFRALLSKHPRVWIVSDHSTYQHETTMHFSIPPEFHIVFEGARNAVYLRGTP